MPSSSARATPRSRSAGAPRTIRPPTSPHPKASADTLRPVLPSVRYSMEVSSERSDHAFRLVIRAAFYPSRESAALTAEVRLRLVDRVPHALRIVVGERPHAAPGLVGECPPCGREGIDHGEEHIGGDALVGHPVPVAPHPPQLVRAGHTRHVDADQPLVTREGLEVVARQLVHARTPDP